jgi:hypothetical protein
MTSAAIAAAVTKPRTIEIRASAVNRGGIKGYRSVSDRLKAMR